MSHRKSPANSNLRYLCHRLPIKIKFIIRPLIINFRVHSHLPDTK